MASKFKHHFNREDFPEKGEVNTLPSLTVPDQTMTMREIMERYARGLPIGEPGAYVEDGEDDLDDLPDIRKLDLAEIQELQEQYQDELALIRDKQVSQQTVASVKPGSEPGKPQEGQAGA